MKINNQVVGFAFSENRDCVTVVHKLRPDWQCGLYNGVGGKALEGEKPELAMEREFHEETGVSGLSWECFIAVPYYNKETSEWTIVYYFKVFDNKIYSVDSTTDELIEIHTVNRIFRNQDDYVEDVPYMCTLALNS